MQSRLESASWSRVTPAAWLFKINLRVLWRKRCGLAKQGREMASGTGRKMGVLLSGLTACSSMLLLFISLAVPACTGCVCLHHHCPLAGGGFPAVAGCSQHQSCAPFCSPGGVGSAQRAPASVPANGSSPCPVLAEISVLQAYPCYLGLELQPMAFFLLLFLVDCSLGLRLQALLKQ